jgi:hypothetical protein
MIDPTTKAAFAALVETMRERIPDPATLPDFGFDPEFLNKTAPVLEFLWSKYFRIRLTGMENVPAEGAALLVANHSGGLPYDGAMLIHATHRHLPPRAPFVRWSPTSPFSRRGCAPWWHASAGSGRPCRTPWPCAKAASSSACFPRACAASASSTASAIG